MTETIENAIKKLAEKITSDIKPLNHERMTMDKLIELIESTANLLRGMCLDPAIPKHAKEAMQARIVELDAAAEQLWPDA